MIPFPDLLDLAIQRRDEARAAGADPVRLRLYIKWTHA